MLCTLTLLLAHVSPYFSAGVGCHHACLPNESKWQYQHKSWPAGTAVKGEEDRTYNQHHVSGRVALGLTRSSSRVRWHSELGLEGLLRNKNWRRARLLTGIVDDADENIVLAAYHADQDLQDPEDLENSKTQIEILKQSFPIRKIDHQYACKKQFALSFSQLFSPNTGGRVSPVVGLSVLLARFKASSTIFEANSKDNSVENHTAYLWGIAPVIGFEVKVNERVSLRTRASYQIFQKLNHDIKVPIGSGTASIHNTISPKFVTVDAGVVVNLI